MKKKKEIARLASTKAEIRIILFYFYDEHNVKICVDGGDRD